MAQPRSCDGCIVEGRGEGGSFGIGASAPFAASQLRTVFYSTATKKTKSAFIGVARLTTHENADGVKVNPNGHLGIEHGKRVTEAKSIPKLFRRSSLGTSVSILGLTDSKNWESQFAISVLKHFWPAIHSKKLVVKVGKHQINAENLEQLLTQASEKYSSFDALEYYRCLETGDTSTHHHVEQLTALGKVQLYLRTGDGKMPKKVAMVRKPGMVVYCRRFVSPMQFCGVFLCENKMGNDKLREMEPPEHDLWTGDRPEKGENKVVERELFGFIRDKVRELTNVDDKEALDIEGLGKFLPDDPGAGKAKDKVDPDADIVPDNASIPTSPIGSKPPRKTTDDLGDLGPTPSPSPDPDDTPNPNPNPSDKPSVPPGDRKQVDVAIEARTFAQDKLGRKYALVVRPSSKTRHQVDLTVRIVGEDKSDPVQIASVTQGSKKIKVGDNGVIQDVVLSPRKSTDLEVTLSQPQRVSLEVVAHED